MYVKLDCKAASKRGARPRLHRLLAMKVLKKSRIGDSRRRAEYIITERKVLRSANHPFVARLRRRNRVEMESSWVK